MFKQIFIKIMSNLIIEECENTPKRRAGRPAKSKNTTSFHYKVKELDTEKTYRFRTLEDVRDKYGFCRATAYLMWKNPDRVPKKYKNIKLEKEFIHHLLVSSEEIP
jgi:hypothetical protein